MEASLPASLEPYRQYISHGNPNQSTTQGQIDKIDAFIKGHTLAIAHVRKKAAGTTYYDTNDFMNQYHVILTVLNYFAKRDDTVILNYEIESLENIISIANEMKAFALKTPSLILAADEFLVAFDNNAKNNPEYQNLKKRRRSIHKKSRLIHRMVYVPDYKAQIRLEFIAANNRYQPDYQYSPPSNFDVIIAEYLIHSPIANIIYPTAKMIADGNPDTVIYTLSEFCNNVYSSLNLTNWQSKAIVYTSIVRFLFNEAYVIKSELTMFNKANALFLLKAEEYSKQSVRDLKLTKDISRYYIPGLSVASIFKSKQLDMLKQMELMTNPIDLMKHVHTIISSLATYFGSETGMVSFDDTLTLILALMSLSPPVNAVSIMKFVDKWHQVQLDDIVGRSKDFFTAAISTLLTEEEINLDG